MLPLDRSGLEVDGESNRIFLDLINSSLGYYVADRFNTRGDSPTYTAGGRLLEHIHRGWQSEETDDQHGC